MTKILLYEKTIKVCKMKNKYRTYLSEECSLKNKSELKKFLLIFLNNIYFM